MKFQIDPGSPELASPLTATFALDVFEGFTSHPKSIPSRWLYDRIGSELFTRIMDLPEYYLTRREIDILRHSAGEMAKVVGQGPLAVIELGAGDGRKTALLLDAIAKVNRDFTYIPVDVSLEALRSLCRNMRETLGKRFAEERCVPFAGDNFEALSALARGRSEDRGGERFLVVYLGSSIGNLVRDEVDQFVGRLRSTLREGDLALIGFDLIKDPRRIVPAYRDQSGVTREFNLNLLERLNRELGAGFDPAQFRHEAVWNPALEGMESWLISEEDQWVEINACGRPFHFKKWEGIRTEVSLKFREEEVAQLAERNGFRTEAIYKDASSEFLDALWVAARSLH